MPAVRAPATALGSASLAVSSPHLILAKLGCCAGTPLGTMEVFRAPKSAPAGCGHQQPNGPKSVCHLMVSSVHCLMTESSARTTCSKYSKFFGFLRSFVLKVTSGAVLLKRVHAASTCFRRSSEGLQKRPGWEKRRRSHLSRSQSL